MSESNQWVVQALSVAAAISSSASQRSAVRDQGTPTAGTRHLKRDGDKWRGVVGSAGEYLFGLFARRSMSLCLQHHRDQSNVTDHREPCNLLVGEHPGDGGTYVLLLIEGFVPGRVPLVARWVSLRPVTARDGLDDHEPSILAPHLFHKRLVIGAVPLVCGEDEVPGRKHR